MFNCLRIKTKDSIILDIMSLSDGLEALTTSNTLNVSNLIQWLDAFIKKTSWNCRNSGYGDPGTDLKGVSCDDILDRGSLKCRIQYRFKSLFLKATDTVITF